MATTQPDPRQRAAPDLVRREFVADVVNPLWVAGMTYVPTWVGFIHLAVVPDVRSRRFVGRAIGAQMTPEPVLVALKMALQQRRLDGVIHHSDQGNQTSRILWRESRPEVWGGPMARCAARPAPRRRSRRGAARRH